MLTEFKPLIYAYLGDEKDNRGGGNWLRHLSNEML
jgi:hypothetical protein